MFSHCTVTPACNSFHVQQRSTREARSGVQLAGAIRAQRDVTTHRQGVTGEDAPPQASVPTRGHHRVWPSYRKLIGGCQVMIRRFVVSTPYEAWPLHGGSPSVGCRRNPHNGMRNGDSIRATVLDRWFPEYRTSTCPLSSCRWSLLHESRDLTHGQEMDNRSYSVSAFGPIT